MRSFIGSALRSALPDCGLNERSVANGLFGNWYQHELALVHFLDFALSDAQFWRIDEVIGRIYKPYRRLDGVELRGRIVAARGIDSVEKIISRQGPP